MYLLSTLQFEYDKICVPDKVKQAKNKSQFFDFVRFALKNIKLMSLDFEPNKNL